MPPPKPRRRKEKTLIFWMEKQAPSGNDFGFLLIEECKSAATIVALCFVENEDSCGVGCNETIADLGNEASGPEATCSGAELQVCTFVECCETCKMQFLDYVSCLYKYSDNSLECTFDCGAPTTAPTAAEPTIAAALTSAPTNSPILAAPPPTVPPFTNMPTLAPMTDAPTKAPEANGNSEGSAASMRIEKDVFVAISLLLVFFGQFWHN